PSSRAVGRCDPRTGRRREPRSGRLEVLRTGGKPSCRCSPPAAPDPHAVGVPGPTRANLRPDEHGEAWRPASLPCGCSLLLLLVSDNISEMVFPTGSVEQKPRL